MDLDRLATQTMEDLRELHQALYRIIEENVEKARLDIGKLPHDPWFFSHYVRFFSCLDLDGLAADGLKIQRAKYAMSGIDLLYRGKRIPRSGRRQMENCRFLDNRLTAKHLCVKRYSPNRKWKLYQPKA